ncbi:MAG: tetratricopeptide repeat protein, partial [bacterium]|nr:tetratricopeptide repeat protein [bacterium]
MDDSTWGKSTGIAAAALAEGKYEEARAAYSDLLAQAEHQFGTGDLRTAGCHQALGEAYQGLGNAEHAERHFQQGVTVLEQQLGSGHPITLRVMTAFGAFYRRSKRFARAEFLLRRVFRLWEQLHSKSGLDVCETLDELSLLYSDLGQTREAERFKDKAELIRQRAKARDEEEMLRTMLTFAQQQIRKRNCGEAEMLLREALAVTDSMHKPNHLQAAQILIELSQLTMTDLRFDEAVSHLERALNILCQSLGDHDAAIADPLR